MAPLRPKLSSATVTLELNRRTNLAREFRRRGFEDPSYADIILQLREDIPGPVLDQALEGEEINLPAPAVPYCMEVHRRIHRISGPRRSWEHLLHHETVILLATVSVQRALNTLLDMQD